MPDPSPLHYLPAPSVKPDPPEDLRVSPIPGETQKLLLEWSPPGSWPFPEYFPLRYRIRYAQEDGSVTAMVLPSPPGGETEAQPRAAPEQGHTLVPLTPWYPQVGPYKQTSLTLSGLRPGALLHIQVAAKDFTDSGEQSAWSAPASGMPWMEP